MWALTAGTSTRWVTRMSTQDQLITLVFSEVRWDYASPVHTLNHLYECVAFTSLRGPQGSGLSHSGSNNKEMRGKGNENNIVDKVYRAGSFFGEGVS